MMNLKVVSAAGLAVVLSLGLASAKTLRSSDEPAEFPPSSFKGSQYVDSRGCVYVRAGIDGAVTWVPRVTRDRKVVCGFKPTQIAGGAATSKPAQKVEQITMAAPAKPTAKAAAPARTVRTPQPVTSRQPAKTVASITTMPRRVAPVSSARVAQVPAPVVTRPKAVAAAKAKAAPTRDYVAACANISSFGQKPLARVPVRCGPQAALPYTAREGQIVTAATAAPSTRVAPRHVYDNQVKSTVGVNVPAGYRPVWEDDRLNTHRAHQTFEGIAHTKLIWTDTTPRRLINSKTGKDVTDIYPQVVYPKKGIILAPVVSTSGTVARSARPNTVKRVQKARVVKKPATVGSQAPARAKATATARPQATSAGKKYVQVGTFGVESNARKTAARLQGLGLPVRMASLTKGGKSYRIVLAGPFGSASQINAALGTARRAGFKDAFLR